MYFTQSRSFTEEWRYFMKKMIFPIITEFDLKLPYYIVGVGCYYNQEHINRPNGFPYYQWIQCRRGSGKLILNEHTYTITENQGMLLFPDVSHEYYGISDSFEVDWIIFQGSFIDDFFKRTAEMKKSGVYYLSQPQMVASKIVKAYEIELSDSPTKSIEISRLTYDILMDILKFSSIKNDSSIASQYNRLKPLLEFIDHNYDKSLCLSDLAQVVGITPQHLCSSFKKITTHTITEYINMTRIKKSKELILQDKNMQIKEIARLVGFQDISYFCSIFKKLENMSPMDFKKLHVYTI
jgi:AraC family transcriptional regulator, arabinose operon regulatory protein